ncbi:MAG TPA: hypothetical protein VN796_08570 [Acidimicrobiales bacterium]|nr:hypothetical protein [Acidimicrobiales bacterium]
MALSTSPAGASSGVTCKKVSGKITSTVTIKKCSPKKATYTKLTGNGSALAGGGTLTWNNGQTLTIAAPTLVTGSGTCPAADTKQGFTTTITSQSAGNTYTQVGDVVAGTVCISGAGALKLASGTTLSL